MENLYIVKIGGNVIDDEQKLSSFLKDFAAIQGKKILVHGGGKLATELATSLNIPQKIIEGRRITDKDTLRVATMVYAGLINKTIVAQLQSFKCNALGITGADGNSILADKRIHPEIDYGYVGDIKDINTDFLALYLNLNLSLVIAPLTHDGNGQLLNTNADTIAREVAVALAEEFEVNLIFCFEKGGVVINNEVLDSINAQQFSELKQKELIFGGMIPKLDNAFKASSVNMKVRIGNAENLLSLIQGSSGTSII